MLTLPGLERILWPIPPVSRWRCMTNSLSPDPYTLTMTGTGLLIALVARLPLALKRLPLCRSCASGSAGAALKIDHLFG